MNICQSTLHQCFTNHRRPFFCFSATLFKSRFSSRHIGLNYLWHGAPVWQEQVQIRHMPSFWWILLFNQVKKLWKTQNNLIISEIHQTIYNCPLCFLKTLWILTCLNKYLCCLFSQIRRLCQKLHYWRPSSTSSTILHSFYLNGL